jgi:hypothetical protein
MKKVAYTKSLVIPAKKLMWDKLVETSNQDSENTYGIRKTMTHALPVHCTYPIADTNMVIPMTL